MKRNGRRIAITVGVAAIAVAGLAASRWPDLFLWWHGYRIVWAPPGLSPVGRINAAGQVAVTFYDAAGRQRPGRWSIFTGEVVAIGPFPDEITLINHLTVGERGSVIGTAYANVDKSRYPFFWSDGVGLQSIGAAEEITQDLNGKDEVVIQATPGAANACHAFRWTAGGGREDLGLTTVWLIDDRGWMVKSDMDLALLKPGAGTIAFGLRPRLGRGHPTAIDGRGRILVNCPKERDRSGQTTHVPFLWTEPEGWTEVPIPAGYDGAYAYGIDDRGDILLGAQMRGEGDYAAWFLVKDGKPVRLLIPPGWDRASFGGMSRSGMLLGRATRGGPAKDRADGRSFVLVPIR